jgi:hypothetical protein
VFVTFFALMHRKATGMGGCAQRKLFTSFLLSILVFMNAAHFKDHMNAPRIGPSQRIPLFWWFWKFIFVLFSPFPLIAPFFWLFGE